MPILLCFSSPRSVSLSLSPRLAFSCDFPFAYWKSRTRTMKFFTLSTIWMADFGLASGISVICWLFNCLWVDCECQHVSSTSDHFIKTRLFQIIQLFFSSHTTPTTNTIFFCLNQAMENDVLKPPKGLSPQQGGFSRVMCFQLEACALSATQKDWKLSRNLSRFHLEVGKSPSHALVSLPEKLQFCVICYLFVFGNRFAISFYWELLWAFLGISSTIFLNNFY